MKITNFPFLCWLTSRFKQKELPCEEYEIIVITKSPFSLFDVQNIRPRFKKEVLPQTAISELVLAQGRRPLFINRAYFSKQSDSLKFIKIAKRLPEVMMIVKGGGEWRRSLLERISEARGNIKFARMAENEFTKEIGAKISEIQNLLAEIEKADKTRYGSTRKMKRLNKNEFQGFISKIKNCEAEIIAVHTGIMLKESILWQRKISQFEIGEHAIVFFDRVINNLFRITAEQPIVPFYEIPFTVSYCRKKGKSLARLTAEGGYFPYIVSTYHLFLREL